MGAGCTLQAAARRLGLDRALGNSFGSQLALWHVPARVLDQGSRLSAVRRAQVHAACDGLGLRGGFDEKDLSAKLTRLGQQPPAFEQRLLAAWRGRRKRSCFSQDVTSR